VCDITEAIPKKEKSVHISTGKASNN